MLAHALLLSLVFSGPGLGTPGLGLGLGLTGRDRRSKDRSHSIVRLKFYLS